MNIPFRCAGADDVSYSIQTDIEEDLEEEGTDADSNNQHSEGADDDVAGCCRRK